MTDVKQESEVDSQTQPRDKDSDESTGEMELCVGRKWHDIEEVDLIYGRWTARELWVWLLGIVLSAALGSILSVFLSAI